MGDFITDYIKSIENPDRIGWNGKVWGAPTLKGYDVNQRGYGIDIRYNNAAKNLVKNRKGLWLTDKEVTDLMNLHLLYITGVAKRKIKGFNTFSPKKQAAILGMLYRGDSVQSNVNVNEPNDAKFLNAVHTYYKNKGLNQRMLNSINFFSKYLKGGKMNVIEQFKKGYKIKIKESLKGSFTKYCNGKVTNECIQRGKNSPDPKIRKKATFADNARHFKHKSGGQLIKAQEGTKLNFGLKVGNFLNSDLGKSALSFISNGVNAISNQSKITNFSNEFDKATEAGKKSLLIQNWNKKYKEGLTMGLQYFQMLQLYNPGINFGTIDILNFAKNYADSAGNSEEVNEYENNRLAMKKDYIQSMLQSASSSGGFDIAGLLGTAGKFLSSKKSNNTETSTGTTNLSTSLNGSPSTYTPSQNTSNVYTGFNLTTPVLPAPTIPIKYNNFTL